MTSLVELRVLEGPNLYFPRAAIKLTLDVTTIVEAPDETALRLARRIGLRSTRPGAPGSGFRQRFAMRAVERLVRAIAAESGTTPRPLRVVRASCFLRLWALKVTEPAEFSGSVQPQRAGGQS